MRHAVSKAKTADKKSFCLRRIFVFCLRSNNFDLTHFHRFECGGVAFGSYAGTA